ncbi:RecX family transcriptional regulator [Candidatus Saccharibacteria bacterium]|nr:RecX family transcriptional regulator [Candidatus Saccharibacteria bacterium]
MKITKLSVQVKNTDRVNVFIDNKYTLSLTLNQILEQKLKVGLELDQSDVNILQKLSQDGKVRARALEWVLLRPHSQKELKQYLQKKQIQPELIDSICNEFVSKKYINDKAFAYWWADNRSRKLKSDRFIKLELIQKGVDTQIVSQVIDDDNSQNSRLKELIKQKKRQTRYQDLLKLKQYLLGKGYSYSDIADALAEDNID